MAIINNNVTNVKFLRNGQVFNSHELAYNALTGFTLTDEQDGTAILARYTAEDTNVKTLVGWVYKNGATSYVTIQDVEGASSDIMALLGGGVSTANTVTAQLTALSGNNESTSAETSVEGAKRYAEDLISELDGGVTAETGSYVASISEVDGKISGTTEELPTVSGEVESKKVVMSVSEDKGTISVDKGTIESSDKTVVIGDLAEGNGIDFKVNIDGETLVADTGTGVISVASAALTQYVGDEDTIHISAADAQNNKTVSSLLTIQKVTTGLSEEVKEEYRLVGASGTTIGDPVKIYKDSHIVSIDYIDDPADEHYQNLEYVYVNASGVTSTTYVDMSELVLEAEFASGLTIENHVARGVVDPASEVDSNNDPFLTVGANGFKVDGIKDEINLQLATIVADLDATVTGATSGNHITVSIEELDGKLVQSGLTIEENDIASASDLAALSAKTITNIDSSNGSITVTPANAADGTQEIDLATDASMIKMSGFTSTDVLSGITPASSVTEAFMALDDIISENERVTAAALTDLDDRVDAISGDVDTISGKVETIETNYVSGVSVNGNAVTIANHVAPISIESATSAMTPSSTEAIVVDTDTTTGEITIGLAVIDCGTY